MFLQTVASLTSNTCSKATIDDIILECMVLSSDGKTFDRPPIKFDSSFDVCNFDESKETRILIHGIKSNIYSPFYNITSIKYFQKNIYNVITVNWLELSQSSSYFSSYLQCFDKIALKVVQFLTFLKEYKNLDFAKVTCVGHSIGAHISGEIGRLLKARDKTYVLGNIVGLDPAGLFFNEPGKMIKDFFKRNDYKERLGKGDANFVVCYFTNRYIYGASYNPVCDLNIDFDSGAVQKYCLSDLLELFTCSHGAAIEYFIESLNDQFCFKAVPKPIPFDSYIFGITSSSSLIYVGEPVEQMRRARGDYVCVTSFPSPYCSYIRD